MTKLEHPTSYNGTCVGLDISLESTTNGPYLSMPQDLTALDPAWSTCNAVLWGAFDPPMALHTATALVQDPGKQASPTPAPGSPVAPPYAPATPTASPIDPIMSKTQSSALKAETQDPKQQSPDSPDPNKPPANTPKPAPQDPNVSKTDPPDPVQAPANDKNGGPATFPASKSSLNGGNVAQGNVQAVSDPQSKDPQRADEASGGDPGVDPGNGNNAGPASNPAETVDQSPVDNTQPLPSIGSHQIQAASGGGIIVASTTLQPGLQTTIDGTPLSVNKGQIVIASSTIPLAPPSADPVITLINGDIISAGGPAATVSGTTVALGSDDDVLVINGKTSPLPPPATLIFTIAGQAVTPAPTGFAIGGQSVLPGGPAVTVAGSTFSLASGSNALIINGKTTPLPTSVFKLVSQTFTAAPTGFVLGTQSVIPGASAITVDGTLISLGSSELIIGTSTIPFGSAAQTRDGALRSLISYGVGEGAKPTNASSNASDVSHFLGESGKLRASVGTLIFPLVIYLGIAIVGLGLI